MRNRYWIAAGLLLLACLIGFLVWIGSFSFGPLAPSTPGQTIVYWAVSTLIYLFTVTLGFMLLRTAVKLYWERRTNREGSRIRTKLVLGALALSLVPGVFLVLFSYSLMNLNLRRWFSRPAENIEFSLIDASRAFDAQHRAKLEAQANWIATLPHIRGILESPLLDEKDKLASQFLDICKRSGIGQLTLEIDGSGPVALCGSQKLNDDERRYLTRVEVLGLPTGKRASIVLAAELPPLLENKQTEIEGYVRDYDKIRAERDRLNSLYIQYMALITLFILFVATWVALLLERQFSIPISALLYAVNEVRKGNLEHRIQTRAVDEMATLVRGFNEMLHELDANAKELERRRRFTEAILESIPTGVISVDSNGRIQRVNHALSNLLSPEEIARASRLEDLFTRDDTAELKYLMKRARRVGTASSQVEYYTAKQVHHIAVTVAALEEKLNSGFVIVLEDTTELLRAQKAAAWHEVARRIAHELKNPLTPISLCAERITRQLDKGPLTQDSMRILRECSVTIAREVQSVKNLADEFSQFARFPAAQLGPADLNTVVRNGLALFEGRLQGIEQQIHLAENLPLVQIDPEQIKRVVVNLVDNAAEAMQESLVKQIAVSTRLIGEDTVEFVVADSGHGVSPEDKERLFLPYFSTKERGTGLGLAIVNHILAEHHANIRAEDNRPLGTRLIVEFPVAAPGDAHAEQPATSATAPS
jgi:two-component system, NtrC family, nitrogen regulation sensor histidine kinase NtrY